MTTLILRGFLKHLGLSDYLCWSYKCGTYLAITRTGDGETARLKMQASSCSIRVSCKETEVLSADAAMQAGTHMLGSISQPS